MLSVKYVYLCDLPISLDQEMAVIRLGENAGVMDLAIKTILDLPSVLLGEDKFFVRILVSPCY